MISPNEARMRALLGMSGYGAALSVDTINVLARVLVAVQLVGLVGLWLFKPWAKWLLLISVVGTVASSPLSGVGVESAAIAPVGILLTLLQGAILALAFTSSAVTKS
jgi:hypothetical protein